MYLPFVTCDKRGSSFDMRVVIYIWGELAQEIFVIGEVSVRDVVRFLFIFLFFILLLPHVYWSCDHLAYIVLIFGFYLLVYVIHLSLHVLFIFSLYAHDSYILYAIYYFCFTLRCRDEFCLKCFRNTDCQSLLAINSLLAKFFKSLCYDRFYCIQ